MSRFMLRARALVARTTGRDAYQRTLQDGFANLETRLAEATSAAAVWHRSCDERLDRLEASTAELRSAVDALDSQVGGQGRSNTERGEAAQNTLVEIRNAVAGIRGPESLGRALDDMRVELSCLRADIFRELDPLGGQVGTGGA